MEFVTAAFNAVLVAFIASTMLAAGLRTRVADLVGVLRRGVLLALVLAANLVVVPLLVWGVAWVFSLSTAATIARPSQRSPSRSAAIRRSWQRSAGPCWSGW
jgi:bile acid:Na+ symporter, BASS family